MNIRRTIAGSAATILVASSLTLGIVAPASAEPPIFIPDCGHVVSDPSYFDEFARINGQRAVAYSPTPVLVGSDKPVLKTFLRAWRATNCSWHLAESGVTRNFTISEVHMDSRSDRLLRRWMANHGIVGVDEEPILGGIAYQVNDHEVSLLIHGRVWISIAERGTSVFGYTMQSAASEIAYLNPWIYNGTE